MRAILLTLALVATTAAEAQEVSPVRGVAALEAGEAAYDEADFEAARAHLDRATEGPLERADVIRLLVARSFVRFALGEFGPLERDLLALATLQPDYALGVRAPPPLHEAFERLREQAPEALGLRVELEAQPAGVRLRATTTGDASGVVERIVLSARGEEGQWQSAEGGTLVLPILSGRNVEIHAEAIGPGGAVLAYDGLADAPRVARVPPVLIAGDGPPRGLSTGAKVGLSIGALVVAGAIATLIVFLAAPAEGIQPQGPFIE